MPAATARRNKLSLVYVIGTYPLLTTTFIDREIQTLRARGAAVQILAMRRPPENSPLSQQQRQLQQGVIYLLPSNPALLLLAHLWYALLRPRAFWGQLFYLLTRPHADMAARWKTLLHFGEAVYTAFLLRKKEFTELHAHFLDRAATVAMVAGRLLGKPFSLSIHAAADLYVQPVLIPEKLAAARLAVTCTGFNKTHLRSIAGDALCEKITHIPHGIDFDCYAPPPAGAQVGNQILAVGQLAERKGFAVLVAACARLKAWGIDFRCQIVGAGPQAGRLLDDIARLGLQDQVSLTGALPHDQVLHHYRQASLFVMPCIQTATGDVDGIPNVLLEAMAMQVPVISTRVSAIPELVVDGRNGLLVPQNDVEALAHAMRQLIEDPELRRVLGERGRESVLAGYNLATNIDRFVNTLWPEAEHPV